MAHSKLPTSPYALVADLRAEATVPDKGTHSRTVYEDSAIKAVLFAFAAGEELSEHTAARPATLQFLEGQVELGLGDDLHTLGPGAWIHMPPGLAHRVRAVTPAVMLLVLLKKQANACAQPEDATTPVRLTELLSHEHRLIQRAVVALARLCAHLRRGAPAPYEAASELLRFVRDYADTHHHAKEEHILFPWMRSQGLPMGRGPIEVMLSEHTEARAYVEAMQKSLQRMQTDGDGADARKRFVVSGEAYATLLWQHILKEDHVLYPMAERLGAGTLGLYDPPPDARRTDAAIEREFGALVERVEGLAAEWPAEDVQWPEGCH